MRRFLVPAISAALLVLAGFTPATAGPSFQHATGGIRMAGPLQYAAFNAFDYGATGDRGTVNYTNFEFPVAGTGVWHVGGTYPLIVTYGGLWAHTMTVDSVIPVSPTATRFSGTGIYDGDASYTWTVRGGVAGSAIWFDLTYTGTLAGYVFHAVGTIASDGSMSGTATDTLGQSPLTWAVPAGSVHEVFSYTASVSCAVILGTDATFGFQIPAGVPYAGSDIVVKIHDGGTPATNGDTWAHGVATSACDGPVGSYAITAGNLVVH